MITDDYLILSPANESSSTVDSVTHWHHGYEFMNCASIVFQSQQVADKEWQQI